MRKVIFSTIILFCSIDAVFAGNDPYVQTVKEMYSLGAKYEDGMKVIDLYSDNSLKQALNVHAGSGEVCGFAQDVMWQSQDPEYTRSVKFSKLGPNRVKASLSKGKWDQASTVIYTLNCNGGKCKVSDIQDADGSLKKNILRECS